VAETAGVNALPVIILVGFLMGLIMVFQAAIPMRQFGAEIYVANLVGLSMVRELGPLMTAIVLAGRSGSAFAAELGTMKVNEEIDALITMGLDPVRFLVVTRILAAVIGCLRGLQTEIGASAVGESTTRAVVGGIVLIVATDGIFSVVYFALKNLVLPRETGSSIGQACPVLRESEIDGSALGFCV
jgi:ABC-type transporter Mla maintaining outer membrane lipid asymmetry permease subunit MlaE